MNEIRRLEKALAETERMWRVERTNARLWKELYLHQRGEKSFCKSCHKVKRFFCFIPCAAVSMQQDIQ